jgi:hypothetical protein
MNLSFREGRRDAGRQSRGQNRGRIDDQHCLPTTIPVQFLAGMIGNLGSPFLG